MNVWVAPVDAIQDARPVTQDTDRGIRLYFWTYNPGYIMYVQDRGGDENWHVYATDVESGETRDLTPFDGSTRDAGTPVGQVSGRSGGRGQ